jgi:TetR/AcrR family transcriptional regulator
VPEVVAPEARVAPDTKALILAAARRRFADHGVASTSLSEIADEVGIRRPSLLHHFPSKDALYCAVLEQAFADWFAIVDDAVLDMVEGWPQVERVLRAAFAFFEAHPDFVMLARREALDVGPLITEELGAGLRPLVDRATRFLEGEMDAGRLRRHDARPRPHDLIPGPPGWSVEAAVPTASRLRAKLGPCPTRSRPKKR